MKQLGFFKQLRVALRIIGIGLVCLLPTPTYGNHGGFYKESKGKSKDEMDFLFKIHDSSLEGAYERWQEEIKEANKNLLINLKDMDINSLNLYGKIYRWFCIITFTIGSK